MKETSVFWFSSVESIRNVIMIFVVELVKLITCNEFQLYIHFVALADNGILRKDRVGNQYLGLIFEMVNIYFGSIIFFSRNLIWLLPTIT